MKNRYSVPYQWGTIGLFIRKQPGKELEKSWKLLFEPQEQPGPFILLDSKRECIGIALKYKSYSANTFDPKGDSNE